VYITRIHNTFGEKSFVGAAAPVWIHRVPSYLRQDINYGQFTRKTENISVLDYLTTAQRGRLLILHLGNTPTYLLTYLLTVLK